MPRLIATYRVRSAATAIDARARAIAVEQSVEMPVEAIADEALLHDIVGEVLNISEVEPGLFEVRIALAAPTVGKDAGQLLNMLFGNTSLHEDVTLHDAHFPLEVLEAYRGPNLGIEGLRQRCGAAGSRAVTCTALKPQGLSPPDLATLAGKLARGGIDFIKDDHSLGDQAYSPFTRRVSAIAAAIVTANRETGFRTRYVPNVSGDLDTMRSQIAIALAEGIGEIMVQPMISGVSNMMRLASDFPDFGFFAHPAMDGSARIAPPLLFGKLLRLFGADVTIYTNYGGRFSYTRETCKAIADAARSEWCGFHQSLPAPAGGMTLERVPELLDFYGPDIMLLIGGSLLLERHRLTEAATEFSSTVAHHFESNADVR